MDKESNIYLDAFRYMKWSRQTEGVSMADLTGVLCVNKAYSVTASCVTVWMPRC